MSTKKANLVFEEPATIGSYNWAEIAATLRKQPGQWAKVFERDRASLAVAIRQGSIVALKPEFGFQVRTRNNDRSVEPRMCTLYLRYVAEQDQTKGRK